MLKPTLKWERAAWAAGHQLVAGADEAGRGAWAGPLVAGAVLLPRDGAERARLTRALNRLDVPVRDSKQLTAATRERGYQTLVDLGVPLSVAVVEAEEIDRLGVGLANRVALARALNALAPAPNHALVDAFTPHEACCTHEAIVHGDTLSVAIALASIVAKVHRDRLMERLHEDFPEYGFCAHKGYGTREHQAALDRYGVCAQHRRSYSPIAEALARVAAD